MIAVARTTPCLPVGGYGRVRLFAEYGAVIAFDRAARTWRGWRTYRGRLRPMTPSELAWFVDRYAVEVYNAAVSADTQQAPSQR
jgi:hypothetical protein